MLPDIAKIANVLEAIGDESMLQAVEGLDAVIENNSASNSSSEVIASDLLRVADMFDKLGATKASLILETIVRNAYPYGGSSEDKKTPREDLYDSKKNNKQTMLEVVRREVADNRKQHHLQTMQGTAPSQTRYSPELPGVALSRVSDGVYADSLTGKVYDFKSGWVGDDGEKHPGGSIAHQTPMLSQYNAPSRMFESRIELSKRKG